MKEINAMRKKTEVLIVGAGPVGQALTIELGQRGVHCLIVEKNARAGAAPRAKTINVRTCEHFRRWGISKALRAAAPLGIDYPSNIAFTTRMSGHLLARFDNALYCAPGRNPLYSEHAQWTPQYTVETVMREHLQTTPNVQVAMNMELLGFKQSDDRIVDTILDAESGVEREVDGIPAVDGESVDRRKARFLGPEVQHELELHELRTLHPTKRALDEALGRSSRHCSVLGRCGSLGD